MSFGNALGRKTKEFSLLNEFLDWPPEAVRFIQFECNMLCGWSALGRTYTGGGGKSYILKLW